MMREPKPIFRNARPTDRPGILGHTDVVPIDEQVGIPTRSCRRKRRSLGRGTCDMKSFVRCSLMPEIPRKGFKIPHPFSHDEEVGCIGVRTLIKLANEIRQKPMMCIVGEPP